MLFRATALLAMLATIAASPALASPTGGHVAHRGGSSGFVTTKGTAFHVDGKPFYFLGTNSYWASETIWSTDQLNTIFTEMATNNITVCRTMAFNDVTTVPEWGAYYQVWTNGTATVNEGERGLGYLDAVIAAAKAAGVKLVVVLVNNWSDFGGMDIYTQQLGGQFHDEFFTSETIKHAYKSYVKTVVGRYKDEKTIMAWELANENRCAGTGGLPTSGNCTTKTITAWQREMSAYVKSLDCNHLVASGDEGFMNSNPNEFLYSGALGVDFEANLEIPTIDYGTYHTYPDYWGVPAGTFKEWGVQWINDHVAAGVKVNKPVVMEEYGVIGQDPETYKLWSDTVLALKSNLQYWQFGVRSLINFTDTYTIHTDDPLFVSTIVPAAAKFKALQ